LFVAPSAKARLKTAVFGLFRGCNFSLSVPLAAIRARMRRGLDLACSLKQAPSRTRSEHDAYESPKREIEHARIQQSLKSITHFVSPHDDVAIGTL
jgi:hypothetical protein